MKSDDGVHVSIYRLLLFLGVNLKKPKLCVSSVSNTEEYTSIRLIDTSVFLIPCIKFHGKDGTCHLRKQLTGDVC